MHTYTYILYIVIHLIEKKRNGVGAYDIWSDMGIGIPYKVYLGSTIRGYKPNATNNLPIAIRAKPIKAIKGIINTSIYVAIKT